MKFAAVLYYVLAIRRCFLLAGVSCNMTGIENENGDHVDGSVLNNIGGSCCWESKDMTISSAAPPGRAGGGRKPVALTELAKLMADFAVDREWDQFHSPRNLLLALVGEVGELSEIFQWKGEVPRGLADWNEAEKEHLGEELSDVLLYLVRLADVCDVDLGQAALHKLQKNAVKYPVDVCKGSFKKFNGVSAVGHNGDCVRGRSLTTRLVSESQHT
ncbi:unnamed protein product [Sphagnum tenellum]